jgi:hypothetical protein
LRPGSDVRLLRLDNHAALVGAVSLGHVLVAEQAPVGDVSGVDGGREEEEGEDALPGFDDTVGDDAEDDVEPDVGEDGPGVDVGKFFSSSQLTPAN